MGKMSLTFLYSANYLLLKLVFNLEKWQNEIKKSMQYLEKETCIRFLERTTTHNDFIVFIRGSG